MDKIQFAKEVEKAGGDLYEVGGSQRDRLLGRPPKDEDFVVTGFDSESFKKAFPEATQVIGQKEDKKLAVFLLHINGAQAEVALARKEVKVGKGYHGFEFVATKDITIEEDLMRRDFTINSMASHVLTGEFIDPLNGRKDIEDKILRANSNAFQEEAVRVYRGAVRYAKEEGFVVEPRTMEMMRNASEELLCVHPNRIVAELEKAFSSERPDKFFRLLQEIGLLHIHFPYIAKLVGVEQPVEHHPEGDAFEHTMRVLLAMRKLTNDPKRLYAALMHDVGKGLTPKEKWPRHFGHEEAGVPLVEKMSEALGVPKAWKQAALLGTKQHGKFHSLGTMRAVKIVDIITEAERNPLKTEGLAMLALADARGKNNPTTDHPYFTFSLEVRDAIQEVKGNKELEGKKAWEDKRNRQASCVKEMQKVLH